MSIEQFERIALIVGVGSLILFMCFIMWDLAKKSKAGRFGTMILFASLGMGLLGFIIKTIMVEITNK